MFQPHDETICKILKGCGQFALINNTTVLNQVTKPGFETFCTVYSLTCTHTHVCILILGVWLRGQKSLGGGGLLFVRRSRTGRRGDKGTREGSP